MKGRSTGIPDVIQFKRLLRDRDLKATPQRMAVPEAMCILTLLADLGIYGRRSGRGGKMVFDVRTGRHLHLYDTESGTWRDLEDEALLTWMEAHFKGRRFRGYKIDGFEVQLLCHPTRKGPGRKA